MDDNHVAASAHNGSVAYWEVESFTLQPLRWADAGRVAAFGRYRSSDAPSDVQTAHHPAFMVAFRSNSYEPAI
jgi:hypothetical protein